MTTSEHQLHCAAVRWGVLGTGNMAGRMVGCIRAAGGTVKAVGSRNITTASAFAERHGIDSAFGSYAELAADADVDAVYIATTNDQHHANAMNCLRHRRAVLCEKPLTTDVGKTKELIATAQSLGVLLVEAMWMKFQPFMPVLEQIIRADALGPIRYLSAAFGFPAPRDATSRWHNRALGGGSVLDIGVYPLTLAHTLLGAPELTLAAAERATTGVDRQAVVCSRHRDGAMSALTSSFAAAIPAEAVIAGPRGHVRLPAPFYHCSELLVETIEPAGSKRYDTSYDGDGLECEIREVHRCLDQSLIESPLMTHADSLAVATWTDDILRQIGVSYAR